MAGAGESKRGGGSLNDEEIVEDLDRTVTTDGDTSLQDIIFSAALNG
jgi:hypothetical protein